MVVKSIDVVKAKQELKSCPKIVRDYVRSLENLYSINKSTLDKAITKLKETRVEKTPVVSSHQVWSEGYLATGEQSGATFHGTFTGLTFRDAVIKFRDSLTDEYSRKCIDIEDLTFWGCRFFDNESDATKAFG